MATSVGGGSAHACRRYGNCTGSRQLRRRQTAKLSDGKHEVGGCICKPGIQVRTLELVVVKAKERTDEAEKLKIGLGGEVRCDG